MKAKLCNYAGCNNLIKPNERYCTKHLSEIKKHIPFENAHRYNEALYKTSRWKQLRKKILKEQCKCGNCGADTHLEIHHIIAPRGNEALFFNESNLETVCRNCHQIITATEIRNRK